jgi:hypothetical protein
MLGRVLIVENEIQFAQAACHELKRRGIDAICMPVPSHDGLNAKQHEDLVLKAVKEILEDEKVEPFDLLITNLNLQNVDNTSIYSGASSRSIMEDDRDSRGLGVVGYVADEHPGLYCIVFTGESPTLPLRLRDDYNIASVVNKRLPELLVDVNPLCDEVLSVFLKGRPVTRYMPETKRRYQIQGVEAMIYRFLRNRRILQRVFAGVPDYDNRLFLALGGHSAKEAVALMSDLWHAEPGLFRYPLADRLGEMESGAAYWEGHREHLVHQLRVYLLGLYLYYGCAVLRKALQDISEDVFLSAWKMMALFHDIGYVFEVDFAQQRTERYKSAFDEINDLTTHCLYHYFESRVNGPRLTRAQDERIRASQKVYPYPLIPNDVLSLADLGTKDLFTALSEEGQRAGIGLRKSRLRDYWNYARKTWSQGHSREPFVDHGITSALILLRLTYALEEYVKKALREVTKRKQEIVDQQLMEAISELDHAIGERKPVVEIAARAIALHNIQVTAWNEDDAYREQRLTLKSFSLSLQETPLTFLLALADELQSWERPAFAYRATSQSDTLAQDVNIDFDPTTDKIVLNFGTDDTKGGSGSRFQLALNRMVEKRLNRTDLDALLAKGPIIPPTPNEKSTPIAKSVDEAQIARHPNRASLDDPLAENPATSVSFAEGSTPIAQSVHVIFAGHERQQSLNRITAILAHVSNFGDGDGSDRHLLCRQAGVADVLGQQIWNRDARLVAGHVVNTLADYGFLPFRPQFHALGGLIDYLLTLDEIPVSDRRFMADIMMRYNLVIEPGYLDWLRERWELPQTHGAYAAPASEQ